MWSRGAGMELAGLHPTKPEQNQKGESAQVGSSVFGNMGPGCRDMSMPFSLPHLHDFDDCLVQHFGNFAECVRVTELY